MPCTVYRSYPLTTGPSYSFERVTLEEALRRVAGGRLSASLIYGQVPSEVRTYIDDECREAMKKGFEGLTAGEQRAIFATLVIALDNDAADATPARAPAQTRSSAPAQTRSARPARTRSAARVQTRSTSPTRPARARAKSWWQFWR